jgi:hypothetical protein
VIKSRPWAYIHVDGRNTGRTTSATPFPLQAGQHTITLINPALNIRKNLTIVVEPDQVVRKFVRLK